jgi:hypothetical protein
LHDHAAVARTGPEKNAVYTGRAFGNIAGKILIAVYTGNKTRHTYHAAFILHGHSRPRRCL